MKRIVIADDSGTARLFIKRCLEIAGLQDAEFLEAANGREALDLLKEKSADLVVTDLIMPEMNGVSLLKRIKSSPRLHETPVIVVTSAANPQKVEELMQMQALAVVSKPISPPDIAEAIQPLIPDEEDNP
ncbi:MAG: response regulator [Thermodesulfobacteriota bacterium]|nr:response regulator [Thermodesulfobacteriota bacterium]